MHLSDRLTAQPVPNSPDFHEPGPYESGLHEKELRLFHQEYNQYFIQGETKPADIGEPYLLKNPLSKKGILLIHGLMAAPEEVREWADFLYLKGYTVYAPRLAGHGTSAVDLSSRRFGEWMDSVDRGHAVLKEHCEKIVIAGFSTGAGLALYQAVQKPGEFEAVISISAPLKFKGFSANFVEVLNTWNRLAGRWNLWRFCMIYVKNHPDNPQINYHRCPIKGIVEVRALMRKLYKSLPVLALPSLIIQGKNDPKVNGKSGLKIFHRIKHSKAYYREINFHQHGIIRGTIAPVVFEAVENFLNILYKN